MSTTEEAPWLRAELQRYKLDLREDLSEIDDKLRRTRTRLKPKSFIGDKAALALSVSFLLGFVLGCWDVPFEDIGKPVARTMAITIGRQMAARALRG
jgi:hypothetical protein